MSKIVSYEKKENIAIITIDDGKANAVSPQFVEEVNAALDRAESDKAVVILTGRPGKFSAGFDLSVVKQGGKAQADLFRSGAELAIRLIGFPFPVIIAGNGHCLAMGALLLLSTDLRIGVEGNYKFGLNEVGIGMTIMHWAVEIARARLSPKYLGRSVVNSEIYTPQGAVEAGFLDEIVPEEQLMEKAMQSARVLAKIDMDAHHVTKLRVKEEVINAINEGIKKDFGS